MPRSTLDYANFIWSIADLLRGDYRGPEYGQVILPLTVLRRLDCVLAPTKAAVLKRAAELKARDQEPRTGAESDRRPAVPPNTRRPRLPQAPRRARPGPRDRQAPLGRRVPPHPALPGDLCNRPAPNAGPPERRSRRGLSRRSWGTRAETCWRKCMAGWVRCGTARTSLVSRVEQHFDWKGGRSFSKKQCAPKSRTISPGGLETQKPRQLLSDGGAHDFCDAP